MLNNLFTFIPYMSFMFLWIGNSWIIKIWPWKDQEPYFDPQKYMGRKCAYFNCLKNS